MPHALSSSYVLAFGLTLLVEVPLYVVALRTAGQIRLISALRAALVVNCLTHPLLWWFLSDPPAAYSLAVGVSEVLVWLAEALLLRYGLGLRGPLPYAAALTANAASILAGLLLLR